MAVNILSVVWWWVIILLQNAVFATVFRIFATFLVVTLKVRAVPVVSNSPLGDCSFILHDLSTLLFLNDIVPFCS
jgi:hypothetical protein